MKSKLTPGLGSHCRQRYHDHHDHGHHDDHDEDHDGEKKQTHTCLYRGQSCPNFTTSLLKAGRPVDSDFPRNLPTYISDPQIPQPFFYLTCFLSLNAGQK